MAKQRSHELFVTQTGLSSSRLSMRAPMPDDSSFAA